MANCVNTDQKNLQANFNVPGSLKQIVLTLEVKSKVDKKDAHKVPTKPAVPVRRVVVNSGMKTPKSSQPRQSASVKSI